MQVAVDDAMTRTRTRTRTARTALAALAALVVAGCQPWYRDAERAGRHAADTRRFDRLTAEASAAAAAGDQAGAMALARAALLDHPGAGPEAYRLYAVLLGATGHPGQARAVLRFALEKIAPDDRALRASLATSYVIDDLIGPAIEAAGSGAGGIAAITDPPELALELGDLQRALGASTPADARDALDAWHRRYGCADHPLIAAAVADVQARLWAAATAAPPDPEVASLATLLADADAAGAAGDIDGALTLYAEAARELPAAELAAHGDGIAAAIAATSTPVRVDPETYALAIAAETALEQGDVGVAIRGLRRALARAPWWTAGHAHLAALLASVGQPDGATPCRHF